MVEGKNDLGLLLYEIVDYARMAASFVRNRRSARTAAVRASRAAEMRVARMHLRVAGDQILRAARANRVFRADEKRIRTENTVMGNTKQSVGVLARIETL
ncbi:MAG: hypothetical protein HY848_20525 [Betaproteobacteria bacterium]|nr:hypothetical protein [Betaproteobacteria bacterium]